MNATRHDPARTPRARDRLLLCAALATALAACPAPTVVNDAGPDARPDTASDVRNDTTMMMTDVPSPDVQRPDGSDRCSTFTTCETCAADLECGFCLSTGRCLRGDINGATGGSCSGTNWAFVSSACPMPDAGPVDVPGDGCALGLARCGEAGACVDTRSDPGNCGACGNACSMGMTCESGACVMPCPSGQVRCGGTCVDANTNAMNCGACGNACPMGQICRGGACTMECTGGQVSCGGSCVNTATSTAHCGSCGNACAAGQSCVAGVCTLPCAAPSIVCGAGASMVCIDPATSAMHCGRCGNACAGGQECRGGACVAPCPSGQTQCGGSCVNTQTDTANCGMCGRACASGQTCATGSCACPMGQTLCGSGATAACRDLATNGAHCGSCGNACASGQTCNAGTCTAMPPPNDTRAGATVLDLRQPSFTVSTDTTNANNNTTGSCGCTSGRDVFYRFTLAQEEIVYADNFGTTYDASLFLQDSAGNNIASANITGGTTCSDDAPCAGMGGGAQRQSQVYARLAAGTYFLVSSGCGQGPTSIKFEHLPVGSGALTQIMPTGATVRTGTLSGTGRVTSAVCSNGPEDTYFFVTCPDFTATPFQASTCNTATAFDSSLDQRSAGRAVTSIANDDGCGLRSNIAGTIPAGAGLHTVYLDACPAASTGAYELRLLFGAACSGGTPNACSAVCTSTATDRLHCGACGNACNDGASCAASACVCPASGALYCGGRCVDGNTDSGNCGACGNTCPAGTTCQARGCRPANNDRANATTVTLATAEVTVTGTNVGSTPDVSGCAFATQNNVWYRFTLSAPAVVYADTAGSSFDTTLFLTDASGVVNTSTCNDDSGCSAGGFTSGNQSRFAASLGVGTYFISVGGFNGATGSFSLHLQQLPHSLASFAYSTAITGTATTSTTSLVGVSRHTPSCAAGASGEDMRFFMTCGSPAQSLFSLCRTDGGSFVRTSGANTYDPTLSIIAGITGTSVSCNDDGPIGIDCTGTGGDTLQRGARLFTSLPRGVHAVIVDERLSANGMSYTLRHAIAP